MTTNTDPTWRLRNLCEELDCELDGVRLPAAAAAIMNAIRLWIDDFDEEADEKRPVRSYR